jgi:hypothetical protein
MNAKLPVRFWIQFALSVTSGALFVVTLIWREWIELVTGLDPDGGNGSAEWFIVGVSAVATILFAGLSWHDWRRVAAATP